MEFVAPGDERLLLVLSGATAPAVPYLFRIVTPAAPSSALTLNTAVAGTIAEPGEIHRRTFVGSVNQNVYFDNLDADDDWLLTRLVAPGGREVFSLTQPSDGGPYRLLEAGTYTLEIDGYDVGTGDYRFALRDMSLASVLASGTPVSGSLAAANQTVLYRFAGTAGQSAKLFAMSASRDEAVWRLVGPGNQTLLGPGSITANLGEAVLPMDGTYLVLVEGTSAAEAPAALNYQVLFTLTNPAVVAASGFGEVREGVFEGEQPPTFTYSATAGTWIWFDSLDNGPYYCELQNSNGAAVATFWGYGDAGPYLLSKSGNYTVVVRSQGAGSYRFRLLNLSAAPLLTLGQVQAGSLAPLSVEAYRFNGVVGQRLYADVLSDNDALSLFDPVGAQLLGGAPFEGYAVRTLGVDGVHYLVVSGDGDYSFQLVAVNQGPAQALALDTVMSDAVEDFEADVYRFSGLAGQRLYLDILDAPAPWNTFATVYGPSDQVVSGNYLAYEQEVTLPGSGQYVMVVHGNTWGSKAYSLRVVTAETVSKPLALGTPTGGEISEPGEVDAFTFAGRAGQRLFYNALEHDMDSIGVSLLAPSGEVRHLNQNADSNSGVFTLTQAGTWTLQLDGGADTVGDYRFNLIEVGQSPSEELGLDKVVNVTLSGWEYKVYWFAAQGGQRLYFDALKGGNGAWWLYSPRDVHLGSAGFGSDFQVVLPMDGTYVLVVGSGTGEAQEYSFQVLTPAGLVKPLALGVPVRGELKELGETHQYTFVGSAGQRLIYDGQEADWEGIGARLVEPSGNVIWDNNADSDTGVFTLGQAGVYTLQLYASIGVTGDYRFGLVDVGQAPAEGIGLDVWVGGYGLVPPGGYAGLTGSYLKQPVGGIGDEDWRLTQTVVGTRADGAIDFGGDSWGTLASAGLELGVNGLDSDWKDYSVQWDGEVVVGVDNQRLFARHSDGVRFWVDGNGDGVFEGSELVSDGWGWGDAGVRLSPGSAALGVGRHGVRVQYYDYDGAGGNVLQMYGDGGKGVAPYALKVLWFEGVKGQKVFYDSSSAAEGSGSVYVYGPQNQQVAGVGGWSNDMEFVLPESGKYLLVMSNHGGSWLSYSFRLVTPEVKQGVAVVGGGVVRGVLVEAGEEARFTFAGSVGQRLYYDDVLGVSQNWTVSLIAPSGGYLYSGNYYDIGPFTLAEAGTYTLVFDSHSDRSLEYGFRLLDVSQAPVAGLDVVVNGTAGDGREAQLYQWVGVAGMRYYAQRLGEFSALGWGVYRDNDAGLIGSGGDMEFVAPGDERLLLVLSGNAAPAVSYAFRVIPGNHAPAVNVGPSLALNEESEWSFTLPATDAEAPNDQLRFSLEGTAPAGLTLDQKTGLLHWIPTEGQGYAVYPVVIVVTDDGVPVRSARQALNLVVNEVNRPPVLGAIGDVTVDELTLVTVTATATDPDLPPNTLSFSLGAGAPGGASIDAKTGELRWTPSEAQGPGTYTITVIVTDNGVPPLSDQKHFQVTVREVNTPPALVLSNQTVDEGTALSLALTATDSDLPANKLTYSLISGPAGLTLTPAGGLSWTPTEAQGPGDYTVTVKVTDDGTPALSDQKSFAIKVNEVNRAPVLAAIGDQTIDEGTALTLTLSATDGDLPANKLTYSLVSGPAGLAVTPAGVLSWTPTEAQGPGDYTVTVKVTDDGTPALSDQKGFAIKVNEVNKAPALAAIGDQTIDEGTALTLTLSATDSDLPANKLTYSLISGPPGLAVTPAGALSWTPTEAQGPGDYTVTVKVTDDGTPALSDQKSFAIKVNEVNTAPVVSVPQAQTVWVGETMKVSASATDSDLPANVLTFSLVTPPAGAQIDAGSGLITWALACEHLGTNTITVRVLDNGTPPKETVASFQVVVKATEPSAVKLAITRLPDGRIRLQFTGEAGVRYRVQASTNLTQWELLEELTGQAGPMEYVDEQAPIRHHRFLRVQGVICD
jgi:hypothetical protein